MHLTLRSVAQCGAIALALCLGVACSDDKSSTTETPTLETIAVTLDRINLAAGQTAHATVSGLDQNGDAIAATGATWSTSASSVASVDANGVVTAGTAGTADITATIGTITGKQTVTVTAPAAIKLNEIESNGGTPDDWAELYNPTSLAVDISGWVVKDNDDTHADTLPANTFIPAGGYYVVELGGSLFGLGAPDSVRVYNPFGVRVDAYGWDTHAVITYGRCPNGTGAFAPTASSTKGAANDCGATVRINEVDSDPSDFIELYNYGTTAVNVGGYILKDNDDTHNYAIPAGTMIQPNGFYSVDDVTLGFGLGAADAARFFTPAGALIDSYSWTAHATTSYGRCPDGTGAFTTTGSVTKNAANVCGSGPTTAAWPGTGAVSTVDGVNVFGTNMSGLAFEAGTPNVIWAARNGPGSVFRLVFDGTIWAPDAANGWSAGKLIHYPDGTGEPDAEGITYTTGSSAGLYVSSERNNSANSVSRNSILRYDATGSATSLTATNEWDITALVPVTGANLGAEAVSWIPDTYLTAHHFYDETAAHTYVPSEYANHAGGLFFVGLEANGMIYAFALDHTANTAKLVATISSGYAALGVMDLWFDRDLGYLWAECDNGCGGLTSTLEIDGTTTSPTYGKFKVTRVFSRPATMANINNEGFTIAPTSTCAGGVRSVFWSDDTNDDSHALRSTTFPCTALSPAKTPRATPQLPARR